MTSLRTAARRATALFVFIAGLSMALAAEGRPDVRLVNAAAVKMRSSASASASTVATFNKGEPILVLETGKKKETVDGKSGYWLKGRSADDDEGWVFGAYLDKAAKGYFKAADFTDDDLYDRYLRMALRRGERVRAVQDYEKVAEGALGWFSSVNGGEPPFLVVWDDDLEATPSDDALDEELPRILEDRVYFVYAPAIEIVGEDEVANFADLGLDWAYSRLDEFGEGAMVTLGRHLIVDGDSDSTNWADEMEEFVGMAANITEVLGEDGWGRPIVHVDIDDGAWQWRVENMRLETSSDGSYADDEQYGDGEYESDAVETYGRIAVGTVVILGKHDDVEGEANWNDDMDKFVGKAAKVVELAGADDSGCLGVRVEGNEYFWRVRNLRLKGHGEAGSYGFDVGDLVILGRHREINGEANWSEDMEEYVGMEAEITSLVGVEEGESRCYLVTVDIDDGEWVWRVENMTPSD